MKKFALLACSACLLTLSAAQDPNQQNSTTGQSGATTQSTGQSTPSQSTTGTSSSDTTAAGQSSTSTTTSSGTTAQSGTNMRTGGGELTQMKTQSFKGTLVDATCAGSGGSAAPTADRASTAETSGTQDSTKTEAKKSKNHADMTAGSAASSCSVSSGTSQFGLRMKDGRTVKFDSVGNQRAQEMLKNKKHWSEAVSSGKTISAKVNGVLSGDKLTVVSID